MPVGPTVNLCAGCGLPIFDRYLFNVLDKCWHSNCIYCVDCKSLLSDRCFSRNGQIFCKDDFLRRFGRRCSGCDSVIGLDELVHRAQDKIFHVKCFKCCICAKTLESGDELYIVDGTKFYCKSDYQLQNNTVAITSGIPSCQSSVLNTSSVSDAGSGIDITEDLDDDLGIDGDSKSPSAIDDNDSAAGDDPGGRGGGFGEADTPGQTTLDDDCLDDGSCGPGSGGHGGTKRRGPRTTIKAKQLETLKNAFASTPKPTRHIREQLAQDTGLNMRVIQVWFQNRRSKERRMKQLRFGGNFRPNSRRRGVVGHGRDDGGLILPHPFPGFPDGFCRPEFFPPHPGFYCDMIPQHAQMGGGGPEGGMHHPNPGNQEMALPPPAFMMGPMTDENGGMSIHDGTESSQMFLEERELFRQQQQQQQQQSNTDLAQLANGGMGEEGFRPVMPFPGGPLTPIKGCVGLSGDDSSISTGGSGGWS